MSAATRSELCTHRTSVGTVGASRRCRLVHGQLTGRVACRGMGGRTNALQMRQRIAGRKALSCENRMEFLAGSDWPVKRFTVVKSQAAIRRAIATMHNAHARDGYSTSPPRYMCGPLGTPKAGHVPSDELEEPAELEEASASSAVEEDTSSCTCGPT